MTDQERLAQEHGPKLWLAINKAAGELPEGCEIHIEIENGAAWVNGYNAAGRYVDFDQTHELPEDITEALRVIIEENEP